MTMKSSFTRKSYPQARSRRLPSTLGLERSAELLPSPLLVVLIIGIVIVSGVTPAMRSG